MYENKNEVWKTYPEFPFIQGSSFGRVRTIDRHVKTKNGLRLIKGRVLKQHPDKDGYMLVHFGVNGEGVNRKVHRIIASCFLSNTDSLPEVNHIDCKPANNMPSNLEWCSPEYNIAYREKYGVSAKEANRTRMKSLFAINLETSEILRFESQHEAARQLGGSDGNINMVIKGRRKQTKGYWFTNADSNAVGVVRAKFGNSMANKVSELLKDVETK